MPLIPLMTPWGAASLGSSGSRKRPPSASIEESSEIVVDCAAFFDRAAKSGSTSCGLGSAHASAGSSSTASINDRQILIRHSSRGLNTRIRLDEGGRLSSDGLIGEIELLARDMQRLDHLVPCLHAKCALALRLKVVLNAERNEHGRGERRGNPPSRGSRPRTAGALEVRGRMPRRGHAFQKRPRKFIARRHRPQRILELGFQILAHDEFPCGRFSAAPTNARRMYSKDRFKWLFTVLTGISRVWAICAGSRSSW